jgi:predicted anti-sigma-YlaC factor YlaD
MNEHPRELLPLIAEGAVPDSGVRAHLDECASCRAVLATLSPLDLDYAWEGIAAELDAPKSSVAERALERAGMEPSLARFVVTTPSLARSWLLASLLVVGLAFAATLMGSKEALSPILVAAPVLAAGLVAFAYGPAADSAYEIAAATPLSPLTALLLRLAAVLAWSSVVVGVADFVAGSDGGAFAWFLPMTGVALLAAAVAMRTQPVVGAAAGMGAWMVLVLTAMSLVEDPAVWLWSMRMQAVYAIAVVGLLLLISRWVVKGRGFVTPIAFPGGNGGMHAS